MQPATLAQEKVIRGQDFEPVYEVTDATGALPDLTSGTVEVRYRLQQGSGTVLEKTKAGGTGQMVVTAVGTLAPKVSKAETAAWTAGYVKVEIVIDISSKRTYQAQGLLLVEDPTTGDIV